MESATVEIGVVVEPTLPPCLEPSWGRRSSPVSAMLPRHLRRVRPHFRRRCNPDRHRVRAHLAVILDRRRGRGNGAGDSAQRIPDQRVLGPPAPLLPRKEAGVGPSRSI